MEKFGVETPRSAPVCPLCGQPTRRQGAVLLCPTHGSEPFEGAPRNPEDDDAKNEPRNP